MELDLAPVQFDTADFRIRRKSRFEIQFYGCCIRTGCALLSGGETHGGVSLKFAELMCYIEREVPGGHSHPDVSQFDFIPARRQLRRKGHTLLILICFKPEQPPDERRDDHGLGPYLVMAAPPEGLVEIAGQ